MAEDLVTSERLNAGKDYLHALARLGFRPDAALWSIGAPESPNDQRLQLTLVSSLVERVGPQEIYELLFEAYDHAGTPKAIDPWIVGLFGADTFLGRALRQKPMLFLKDAELSFDDGRVQKVEPMEVLAGQMFQSNWVYIRNFKKRDVASELRQVSTFRRNVQKLAA